MSRSEKEEYWGRLNSSDFIKKELLQYGVRKDNICMQDNALRSALYT